MDESHSQLHHYDDNRSLCYFWTGLINILMFFADKQSSDGRYQHPSKIESDLYLFDELSSVGNHSVQAHHHPQPQPPIHSRPFFAQDQESRVLTLNAMEARIENQPEAHLFLKMSEDFKEENLSEKAEEQKKIRMRMQNDTKNIPKNFGKGIVNFILKNDRVVRQILSRDQLVYGEFMKQVRARKKSINTIAELRRLWTDQKIGRSMRIISNLFFRKYALGYIFNSRICSFATHIKYRQALWEALVNPSQFNHIKHY